MATLPCTAESLIEAYGPHLNHEPPGGFAARTAPDRTVNTHCCFCGQQCGVTLAVKDERVVGVEPWEEFPFNQGKLCPKGIKRYLQNNHPDRLTRPLVRTGRGFAPIPWDEALDIVAERIRRIQLHHGRDSVAVLSGASLTNEKAYLMGKFARLAVGTRHIDYNGRLCMVAAGAANLKAFGIDRAANPWADIVATDLVMVLGSNVSECSPITTDYIWRARDRGARLIVVDPRLTPIARTADLYLPVRPGRDAALMNAILHAVVRLGGVDEDFIAQHTTGFEAVREAIADCAPEAVERLVGIPAERIVEAAELPRPRTPCCCTPAASSTTPTASRTCSRASTSCSRPGRSGSPAAATRRSPGRATGRARASTASGAISSPAGATSRTRPIARTSPRRGASPSRTFPARAPRRPRSSR